MKFSLGKEFTEITIAKPFTLTAESGNGVEICDGATRPGINTGKLLAIGEDIYIKDNAKVWARALGGDAAKAVISVVGF